MSQLLEKDIQAVLDAEVDPCCMLTTATSALRGSTWTASSGCASGACATCMGAGPTVNDIIVASIRQACPSVADVRVETGVSHELIAEALRFLKRERQ